MLFSHHKPRWLYAAMPVIYLAAGIVVLATLRNTAGRISGSLLVAASVAIFFLRSRGARAARAADARGHSSQFAPASRLAATTEFVRGIAPPELGHMDIDRQHRGLASRAATLRVAFAHGDDPAELEQLTDELVDAFARHLDAEVDAMDRLGIARSHDDLAADRVRLAGAARGLAAYRSGMLTLEALIDQVAGPLVAGHLGCRHPPLPSMEAMLQQLREVKAAS